MRLRAERQAKFSLGAIFFTFFIDSLSWAVVFPIFAPYFLDVNDHLFKSDVNEATRTTILGLFLAAFSLGQFFGAPLLGDYADRFGRKRTLLISVFFTLIGLGLTAWSMERGHLSLLFIGRLITGFFAGNTAICLACIADLYKEEQQKAKQFGHLSSIAGGSFIIGAFVGGKLSDSSLEAFFFPSLPLWIAMGLTFLNFVFILFGFSENGPLLKGTKFDVFHACKNIKEALRTEKLKTTYVFYFLFVFSWTILVQFSPVLMVRRFSFTNSNIGDLALFMGVCWAIGSSVLNKFLLNYFSSLKVLVVCLFAFTALLPLMIYPTEVFATLGVMGACVTIAALAWPLCNALISDIGSSKSQGKVLGMSQSVQSLAMVIAPILGGAVANLFLGGCFILGALASLVASVLYFVLRE
jgi:DHA1 family tetracycline resistance protein-like MFS transporter